MSATIDRNLHPHERVAFQKRRLLWILGSLSLTCVAGMTFAYWLWNWRQSHRVSVILVAAAERGEPVSGDELNAYFRAPSQKATPPRSGLPACNRSSNAATTNQSKAFLTSATNAMAGAYAAEIPSHLQRRAQRTPKAIRGLARKVSRRRRNGRQSPLANRF